MFLSHQEGRIWLLHIWYRKVGDRTCLKKSTIVSGFQSYSSGVGTKIQQLDQLLAKSWMHWLYASVTAVNAKLTLYIGIFWEPVAQFPRIYFGEQPENNLSGDFHCFSIIESSVFLYPDSYTVFFVLAELGGYQRVDQCSLFSGLNVQYELFVRIAISKIKELDNFNMSRCIFQAGFVAPQAGWSALYDLVEFLYGQQCHAAHSIP